MLSSQAPCHGPVTHHRCIICWQVTVSSASSTEHKLSKQLRKNTTSSSRSWLTFMFLLVFFPRLDGFICFRSPSVVKKGTFMPFLHLLPMTGDFIVQALGFSQIFVKYLPNICPDPSSYLVCCPSEWNIGVKTRLVCQSPQIGLILMVAVLLLLQFPAPRSWHILTCTETHTCTWALSFRRWS